MDSCEIKNVWVERRYILAVGLSRGWLSVTLTVLRDARTADSDNLHQLVLEIIALGS